MAEAAFRPPQFKATDVNACEAWREFKDEMDNYFMAAGLNDAEGERKVAILLYGLGAKYRKIFNSLTFNNVDDKKNYARVLAKFDEHFEPKRLTKLYMRKFDACVQNQHESIGEYVSNLREIAKYCDFGATLDNQLCKQISSGVHSTQLRDKLWGEDLTLEQIIKKCHLDEQRHSSRDVIDSQRNQSSATDVHYASHRGRGYQRGQGSRYRGSSRGRGFGRGYSHQDVSQQFEQRYQKKNIDNQYYDNHGSQYKSNCSRCGRSHPPKSCPAYGKYCNFCHGINHFAKVCRRKKQTSKVYELSVQEHNNNRHDDEYEFVDANCVWYNHRNNNCGKTSVSKSDWSVAVDVPGNGKMLFKLDTGADSSVMSKQCFDAMKYKPLMTKSKNDIVGLSDQRIQPIGEISLMCYHKGKKYYIECEVVDTNVPNLLSRHDCIQMNLVRRVHVNEKVKRVALPDNVPLPDNVQECKYESAKRIIEEYKDVFQGIGKLPGEVGLKVDPNITPVVHPPRPIPVALREPVRRKLQELEKQDIIETIPIGTPTPWCSALHVVSKRDGTVRITIDPKDLNTALQREYYPTNTVENVAQRCGSAKFMTVLDANQGYFQIVLDEKSRDYTAFNTPFGRYRYKRLPMGISSAPELFQRVFGDIFSRIDGLEIIMDDCLIACDTLDEHNRVLRQTLEACRENNITLSLKKLQLCTESVQYAGHKFTHKGLELDNERIRAITEMPEPQNIAQVHTLLGMVTYVCKFMKNLSSVTEPLRSLIKESNQHGFKWHFDQIHTETFKTLKKMMSSAPVLKFYNLQDPVVISCDASQSGLGCVLLQNDAPVAYGSKALTTSEYAYAQIEKELLAIVFAFKKFHTYVYGRSDITVETDHSPLVRILEKPLHQVPLRLQKMRMKLQGYDFKLIAKRGTEIPVADALSRAYISDTGPDMTVFTVSTHEISNMTQISPPKMEKIKQHTTTDRELQSVIKTVTSPTGWPNLKSQVDPVVKPYFDFQEELNVIDGILYKGQRVVIPISMRPEALKILHAAHQGMVKSKQLARDLLYWPGVNKQIEDMVSRCSACQEHRPMQAKEPLLSTPIPTRPWEHVAADLFDCLDAKWLICVDYYSEYFEVERMDNGTHGQEVIRQCKKWFSVHGIPEQMTTDNGPPFNGIQWKEFEHQYRFHHTPISPLHSQSNGMAEKAVGIVKMMLRKCDETGSDPYLALLNIRNTPRNNLIGSPAQRLFSRRTRTILPTAKEKLQPEVQTPKQVTKGLEEQRHKIARRYFNRNTKPLRPLGQGDTIRVRTGKTWQPAQLLSSQCDPSQPRSYKIQLPSGRFTRRNRQSLLHTNEGRIYHKNPDLDVDMDEPEILQPDLTTQATQPTELVAQGPNHPPTKTFRPTSAKKDPEYTRSGRISKPPDKLTDFVK